MDERYERIVLVEEEQARLAAQVEGLTEMVNQLLTRFEQAQATVARLEKERIGAIIEAGENLRGRFERHAHDARFDSLETQIDGLADTAQAADKLLQNRIEEIEHHQAELLDKLGSAARDIRRLEERPLPVTRAVADMGS